MSKTIVIKITRSGSKVGPFSIYDQSGNLISSGEELDELIVGKAFIVDDTVTGVTLTSTGACDVSEYRKVGVVSPYQFTEGNYSRTFTACLWRHLTDVSLFNNFYNSIEPYIIEYPFSYAYNDEILQSVQDYTKAYQYLPDDDDGVYISSNKIEVDDIWFNKAVLYNGQQSSGILELNPKPVNNMKAYMEYPKYYSDRKGIIYTKSDNFYQYNMFWSIVVDTSKALFRPSCESLSVDKVVNQSNMDYSVRSFSKGPLRAKEARVRHILDNRSDVHLVSQFILTPSQISYK